MQYSPFIDTRLIYVTFTWVRIWFPTDLYVWKYRDDFSFQLHNTHPTHNALLGELSVIYRTLLAVHPTDERLINLAPVVALARTFNAHVDVLIVSALTAVPTMIVSQVPNRVWGETIAEMARKCEERSDAVSEYFANEGVGVSVDVQAQQISLLDKSIAKAAVCCDLVVMQRNESLVSGVAGHALEGALFDAGKPVLVLDHNTNEAPIKPDLALIAWDGSREVARAIHHSVPMLREAISVQAFAIDENKKDDLRNSMKALSRQLSRHDIKLDTRLVPREGQFISDALVNHVTDTGPSLLVMGAYGQTRMREFVFSGTTRAALTHDMNTALLLAH